MSGAEAGPRKTSNSSEVLDTSSLKSWEQWFENRADSEEKLDGIEYFMRVHNIWSEGALNDLVEHVQKTEFDSIRGFKEIAKISVSGKENAGAKSKYKNHQDISDKKLLRKLEQFLRIAATRAGTPIDKDGYIQLDWVLGHPEFHGVSMSRVMPTLNRKGREKFDWKAESGVLNVRVNYDSRANELYECRVKLAVADLTAPLSFIAKQRKLPMLLKVGWVRENHEFFVFRPETQRDKENPFNITVFIDVAKACADGMEFYAEKDQRVVTRGNRDECIPPEYIFRIQFSMTGKVIYPRVEEPKQLEPAKGETGHVMLVENDVDYAHHAWVSFGEETVDRLMLLDTGAQISILQLEAYKCIPEKLRPVLVKSDTKICVGDGAQLGCEGMAIFKMQINYQEFYHKLYVCRKASQSILGNDFLVKHDGVLSLGNGKMTLRGHPVPIFNRFGQELKRKVQLVCNVEVPAGQEAEIPARISGKMMTGRPVMFEPNVKNVHLYGIMMPAILYSGCDARVRLRVFNMGEKPVKLNALMNVGEVSEIDGAESLVNLQEYDVNHEQDDVIEWVDDSTSTKERGEKDKRFCHLVFKDPTEQKLCANMSREEIKPEVREEKQAQLATQLEQSLRNIEMPEHMKIIHEKSTKGLSAENKTRVTEMLYSFSDIFAKDSKDIGKTTLITHDVCTGTAKPVCQAVRRQSPEEHKAMKDIVEELYRVGVVAPSRSEWASNIRMAKKKNGSWRMCIDYRDLNKRTIIHDPYPLPRIDSMLDALGEGRYFSCLDLISGYHQVPLTPAAQERTAFITPKMSPSHWEYKYMPFGLMSAPATFQRLVDTMLRGIQYDTCMAYLDDIIVISSTVAEGITRLREVFERIRMAKLKLKAEKCDLFKEEITFLGHVISADGVKTDPKKVAAIRDYTVPLYVTDVRGFLGMCSYYRRFIQGFSKLTKPLNDLTKKDSARCWLKEHTDAFEELKRQLSDTPVLAYPREDCTYILDTDASSFAIGAVLSQYQPEDVNTDVDCEIPEKLGENSKRHVSFIELPDEAKPHAKNDSETDSDWERCKQRGYKKRPGCIALQIIEDAIRRKGKEDARMKSEGRRANVNLTATEITVGDVTYVERPVAYASRMLLPREMSYCTRRREFLAIYEMVQYFRHYLAGTKFILRTDHDSLKGVKNLAKLPGQFARWIDYLEGFQFEIQVRKGSDNANADFLSRMYSDCFCKENGTFTQTPSACEALENEPVLDWEHFEACNKEMRDRRIRNKWNEIIKIEDPVALASLTTDQLETQIKLATKIPPHKGNASGRVRTRPSYVNTITSLTTLNGTAEADVSEPIKRKKGNVMTSNKLGVKQFSCHKQIHATSSEESRASDSRSSGGSDQRSGVFKPRWTKEQLKTAQRNDEELRLIYAAKVDGDGTKPEWNALSFEGLGCKFYYNQWTRIRVRHGLLYREWESASGDYKRLQLIIPKTYQMRLIQDLHCTPIGNHQGNHRTIEFLRLRFFWYGMADQVKQFIKQCLVCQQAKILNKTPRTPMQVLGAGFPNERVNVDFCGPFGDRDSSVRYILVMCDAFTKFTVAVPTKDMTARTAVAVVVERWINILGAPYELHSDRGASFTAATWKEFCERMGIQRTITTSYRPQANGQVERSNRSILEMLRAMVTDVSDWDASVSHVSAAYNYTPHATHGFSPYFLMFGRHPYSMLDVTLPTELNGAPMSAQPISESVRRSLSEAVRAHSIARQKLKAAAEVSRRFYNRGCRLHVIEYEVGERAWLKIEQIREHGKLTDKFQGPYYIVTKWGTGTYRIARALGEPPKIVHHDRMRKYIVREAEPIPDHIQEMIKRFSRNKHGANQTAWDQEELEDGIEMFPSPETLRMIQNDDELDEIIADSEEEQQQRRNAQICVVCGESGFDEYGIFRMIFMDEICHICRE